MDELNSVPAIKKVSSVIEHLPSGKAPGADNIPPDLNKTCKSTLISVHKVQCQFSQERDVPQGMPK